MARGYVNKLKEEFRIDVKKATEGYYFTMVIMEGKEYSWFLGRMVIRSYISLQEENLGERFFTETGKTPTSAYLILEIFLKDREYI